MVTQLETIFFQPSWQLSSAMCMSGHAIGAEVMCVPSGNALEMKSVLCFSYSYCVESAPDGLSSQLGPWSRSPMGKVAEEKDRMNWKQYCAAELPGQPKACRKRKFCLV